MSISSISPSCARRTRARRHADQRTVADRLPGRRSVRPQDQGFRSHHLRPLFHAGGAAAGLSRQYRALCARRRRAVLAVGPEFETPEGLFNTPLGEISPARPTGEDVLSAFKPEISADGAKHPVTRALPGARGKPAGLGRLVPRHRRQAHGGRQRDAGGAVDAAAGAVARRQGPRRAAAAATRSGCGRAATTAAARISTCCAASRIG